ncbi:MAG: hypothetical protein JXA90_04180 [Planctomycetes bacterium]|nr:hypothetical protein [Planctomycetota bacterium]
MRLNREKVVTILAAIMFLPGIYQVVVGVVTPRPDIRLQDISLEASRPEVASPRYRRYASEGLPKRNPFSVSEGWRRLDSLPLDPPPAAALGWLVPLPSRLSRPDDAGLRYIEIAPAAADSAGERGAPGGAR